MRRCLYLITRSEPRSGPIVVAAALPRTGTTCVDTARGRIATGICRNAVTVCASAMLIICFCSASLRAQDKKTLITVHVTDSVQSPVREAAVELVPIGMMDSSDIRQSVTDSAGLAALRVLAPGSYELVVRRLGYTPATRQLRVGGGDSSFVEVSLSRTASQLATVHVDAARLPQARQPDVSAAEIAATSRSLLSLGDVMGKLRPDVTYQAKKCLPLPIHGPVTRGSIPRTRLLRPPEAVVFINGRQIPADWDPWDSVNSEQIAHIHYVNCFDESAGLPVLPWPAIYVVLKPGFEWDLKRGSHAIAGPD
jgi:hypothetical protein